MSEPTAHTVRVKPGAQHSFDELNTLVMVPGNPCAIRAFSDDDVAQGKAAAYAEETGGYLQSLPLEYPDGAAGRGADEPTPGMR